MGFTAVSARIIWMSESYGFNAKLILVCPSFGDAQFSQYTSMQLYLLFLFEMMLPFVYVTTKKTSQPYKTPL